MDYQHLATHVAETRYAIAALQFAEWGVGRVLEIGGTRISDILSHWPDISVDAVDPTTKGGTWPKGETSSVKHWSTTLEGFDFEQYVRNHPGEVFGLCMLGVELRCASSGCGDPACCGPDISVLRPVMARSVVFVLDYVVENKMASSQAKALERLAAENGLQFAFDLYLTFGSDASYSDANSSFGKLRRLVVYRNDNLSRSKTSHG